VAVTECRYYSSTWLTDNPGKLQAEYQITLYFAAAIVAVVPTHKTCKVESDWIPSSYQHLMFYRPDVLPVAQPTVSKYRMK